MKKELHIIKISESDLITTKRTLKLLMETASDGLTKAIIKSVVDLVASLKVIESEGK